uniref:Uncharacterized protein n=1 Tax=Panagrolaimus superbus TaxID=310955 RepID=A0A914YXT0_9BILA
MVIRKARKWLTANAKTLTHPTTENIEIIIYQQQHPTHFHGTFIDPTIQQHHIYYANPAFEGNFNHASMLPSGYEDDIPRDNFQQTAMSQSQLQRLYNGTSSASSSTTTPTPSQYPTNTIRYPTLPSAPPHSP